MYFKLIAGQNFDALPAQNQEASSKKWRRADTNVVSVQLEELVSPSNMHTGEYVRCHNCKGVMSYVSQLKTSGEDTVSIHKNLFYLLYINLTNMMNLNNSK